MDKKQLETLVSELLVEREVEKRVKLRCIAFWSTVLGIATTIGSWLAANLNAVKIGLRAFWEAWLKNG